jgi:hypothetical protein
MFGLPIDFTKEALNDIAGLRLTPMLVLYILGDDDLILHYESPLLPKERLSAYFSWEGNTYLVLLNVSFDKVTVLNCYEA